MIIPYILIILFILVCIFYHPTDEKKHFNYLTYIDKAKEDKFERIKLKKKS